MSQSSPLPSGQTPALIGKIILALIAGSFVFLAGKYGADKVWENSINERFKNANDQLGVKNPTVRNGAVIAMGAIIKDSPEKQWQIVQTLSDLVRTNSPVSKELNIKINLRQKAPLEVITAIRILKERNPEQDNTGKNLQEQERIIHLKGANLFGIDLEKAQLPKADLSDSDLTNVSLLGANLEGAYLRRTYLRGAGLKGVNLSDADLTGADLGGAELIDVDLSKAKSLSNINLAGANLAGAIFTDEQIEQACNWEQAKYEDEDIKKTLQKKISKSSKSRAECNRFNLQQDSSVRNKKKLRGKVNTLHRSKFIYSKYKNKSIPHKVLKLHSN